MNNKNSLNKLKQRKYFLALEKKRLECQLKLDKAKFDFVLSKVIGEKKSFVRNYSFLFEKPKQSQMISNKDNFIQTFRTRLMDSSNMSNKSNNNLCNSHITFEPNIFQHHNMERQNSNEYQRKMFKKQLFADIYQKQLPNKQSQILIKNMLKAKMRNKGQRDKSTSCEPIHSKLPSIKTLANYNSNGNNNVRSTSSCENITAMNYMLSVGISSIKP